MAPVIGTLPKIKPPTLTIRVGIVEATDPRHRLMARDQLEALSALINSPRGAVVS